MFDVNNSNADIMKKALYCNSIFLFLFNHILFQKKIYIYFNVVNIKEQIRLFIFLNVRT